MKRDEISRKKFLIILLATSGISFFGGQYLSSMKFEDAIKNLEQPITDVSLTEYLEGVKKHAAQIGKVYLEDSPNKITQLQIIKKLNLKIENQKLNSELLLYENKRIEKQIMNDFRNSEFVEVDNWLITLTEAYLCSYAYLKFVE